MAACWPLPSGRPAAALAWATWRGPPPGVGPGRVAAAGLTACRGCVILPRACGGWATLWGPGAVLGCLFALLLAAPALAAGLLAPAALAEGAGGGLALAGALCAVTGCVALRAAGPLPGDFLLTPDPVTPTHPRRLCISMVGRYARPVALASTGRPLMSTCTSNSYRELEATLPCCLLSRARASFATCDESLSSAPPDKSASLTPEIMTESPARNPCAPTVHTRHMPPEVAQTDAICTFAASASSWQAHLPAHIRQTQSSQRWSRKAGTERPASGSTASSLMWPRHRSQKMRGHLEQPSGAVKAPRHEATPCVQRWHDRLRSCGLPAVVGGTGG
mmetsp:Transcript_7561/g.24852  ORF Transcript_7561/g.24852 Transcript_7561/m.24852 type:complete len:334 (-) Transcript_7561:1014-2015(-)